MDKIRVIVADDHPIFREGVVRTLDAMSDFEVVDEAADATDAFEKTKDHLPDVVLLDVSMPGGGITAAGKIASCCPVVKIIVLTASEDEQTVHQALSAGASGYVLKGVSGNELIGIVRGVVAGDPYITPALAAVLLQQGAGKRSPIEHSMVSELTPRERDILSALAGGSSNKEIAARLGMAERTVKHHMTNILSKLQLKNRVEAALFAQKNING